MTRKAATFWPIALLVLAVDVLSKRAVVAHLSPWGPPVRVIGDAVRLALAYNTGAAFSMTLGSASRWGFTALALVALLVLGVTYRAARANDVRQAAAIGLIVGGALGNLLDRLRSSAGVVDFIDVGIGAHRFWTFNVADAGVTVGAIALAVLALRGDSRR